MVDRENPDIEISGPSGEVFFKGTSDDFHRTAKRIESQTATLLAFPVPDKADFEGKQFMAAPELKKIADALIERYENDFPHLGEANIKYLWKETGGESGGYATLGKCIRPTGLAAYFATEDDIAARVDYVIWAAADHLRENKANERTVNALMFHELKHTDYVDGKYIVVSHEFEGFAREIEEFGMWQNSIKRIAEACETVKDVQQGLFTNHA